tara:strand:+ start:76 stop:744 length:669 start_codon:yes stop_codon:yes gene_type:complete
MLEIVNVKKEIPSHFESVNKFSDTITIENRVPYVSLIFPDHKDVNPIIHELIKNNVCHQTYTGALSTTPQNGSGNRHIEEIDKLFSWIEDSLSDCVDKLAVNSGSIYNSSPETYKSIYTTSPEAFKNFKIAEYWGMFYPMGSGATSHTHFPYPISFAYYVNVPKGSSPFTLDGEDISVEDGMLIVFAGDMYHEVKKSKCEERSMLSGNVIFVPNIPEQSSWE